MKYTVEPAQWRTEPCSSILFTQVVDQVDHLSLANTNSDGTLFLPQDPSMEDDPEAIEEQ